MTGTTNAIEDLQRQLDARPRATSVRIALADAITAVDAVSGGAFMMVAVLQTCPHLMRGERTWYYDPGEISPTWHDKLAYTEYWSRREAEHALAVAWLQMSAAERAAAAKWAVMSLDERSAADAPRVAAARRGRYTQVVLAGGETLSVLN